MCGNGPETSCPVTRTSRTGAALPRGRTCPHSSLTLPFPNLSQDTRTDCPQFSKGRGKEGDGSPEAKLTLLPFSCRCGKALNGICKCYLYSSEFFSKLGWGGRLQNPNHDGVLQSQARWESLLWSSCWLALVPCDPQGAVCSPMVGSVLRESLFWDPRHSLRPGQMHIRGCLGMT